MFQHAEISNSHSYSVYLRIVGLMQGRRGLLDPPPDVMPFNLPGIPHRVRVVLLSPHEVQMMCTLLDLQSNDSPRDVLPDASCRATMHVRRWAKMFWSDMCENASSAEMQALTSAPTTYGKQETRQTCIHAI